MLRGRSIEINEGKRAARVAEMPEIEWIENRELRDKVIDAWVAALEAHGFTQISEMKPSGNYDFQPVAHRHAMRPHALGMPPCAQNRRGNGGPVSNFRYNRDILIAGALCHDIGKVWEFQPDNVKRWKADPHAVGFPSVRHPGYGVFICFSMDLPEAVAHIAAAHSAEGELLNEAWRTRSSIGLT